MGIRRKHETNSLELALPFCGRIVDAKAAAMLNKAMILPLYPATLSDIHQDEELSRAYAELFPEDSMEAVDDGEEAEGAETAETPEAGGQEGGDGNLLS